MKIILASGSPRRAKLLREAGVPIQVVVPGVPEILEPGESPEDSALATARRKGETVASLHPDAVVIAADTLAVVDGKPLGKPKDLDDARAMLESLSGRAHTVITAVAIEQRSRGRKTSFSEESRVTFKTLAEEDIVSYLAAVDVLDKAGAYAVQERADILGARVEGSFSNVMGLPVKRVVSSLRELGWTGPS